MKHRRLLFKLGLFVLAGALVNVAVAWGLAVALGSHTAVKARCPAYPGNVVPLPSLTESQRSLLHNAGIRERLRKGRTVVNVHNHRDIGFQQVSFDPWIESQQGAMSDGGPAVFRIGSSTGATVVQISIGFPVTTLYDEQYHYAGTPIGPHFHGLRVPELGGLFPRSDGYFVPIGPVWPGFAINTIFYAAILWLLFAAPFKVRRWRRIRRGQCPACAYPVGASETCTECGAQVKLSKPVG